MSRTPEESCCASSPLTSSRVRTHLLGAILCIMASATDESAICPICMTVASQETHNLTSLVSGFLRLRLVSGFLRLRLPGTLADES